MKRSNFLRSLATLIISPKVMGEIEDKKASSGNEGILNQIKKHGNTISYNPNEKFTVEEMNRVFNQSQFYYFKSLKK